MLYMVLKKVWTRRTDGPKPKLEYNLFTLFCLHKLKGLV